MDYRPPMTDEQEYQDELENAIDDCITYIILAIQSINDYREFNELKNDIQTVLKISKDYKKEGKENE